MSKPKLSQQTIAAFEKIKQAIIARPDRYDQQNFCGSAMCLAGHAVAQCEQPVRFYSEDYNGLKKRLHAKRQVWSENHVEPDLIEIADEVFYSWEDAAVSALGLVTAVPYDLFGDGHDWPSQFADPFFATDDPKCKAYIACARIDHFLETGK